MAQESAHQCRYKLSIVINSANSSACYAFTAMDALTKTADNFQPARAEEIKQELFVEFVNKIAIWDYYGVSREAYLALSDIEKRERISEYYFGMKSRSSGGKTYFLFVFSVRMQPLGCSYKRRKRVASGTLYLL